MEFRTPYLAIGAVVVAIFWLIDFFRVGKKPQLHFFWNQDQSLLSSFVRFVLFCLAICSFILIGHALMGPRVPNFVGSQEIEVNDIFMVVDVSKSMLAEDFEPNRMEVARESQRFFEDEAGG